MSVITLRGRVDAVAYTLGITASDFIRKWCDEMSTTPDDVVWAQECYENNSEEGPPPSFLQFLRTHEQHGTAKMNARSTPQNGATHSDVSVIIQQAFADPGAWRDQIIALTMAWNTGRYSSKRALLAAHPYIFAYQKELVRLATTGRYIKIGNVVPETLLRLPKMNFSFANLVADRLLGATADVVTAAIRHTEARSGNKRWNRSVFEEYCQTHVDTAPFEPAALRPNGHAVDEGGAGVAESDDATLGTSRTDGTATVEGTPEEPSPLLKQLLALTIANETLLRELSERITRIEEAVTALRASVAAPEELGSIVGRAVGAALKSSH